MPMLTVFVDFLVLANNRPPAFEDTAMHFQLITLMHLMLITILSAVPPFSGTSSLPLHERLLPEYVDADADWTGRDLFKTLSEHRRMFWYATANTPETFQTLFSAIRADLFAENRKRNFKLSPKNRVLMTLIWLRNYPTYAMMSMTFNISLSTVAEIIESTWMVMWEHFAPKVQWHSLREWRGLIGKWPEMPNVVGAIDATSHEILIPTDEQHLFYSGHGKFHCIHTQVIMDNEKRIVYIHSGFDGHENDAVTYRQLPSIGPGLDIDFPQELRLLGDSIYPNEYPLITPYRAFAIRNVARFEQRRRRLYNAKLRSRRVYVEHIVNDIKTFRCIAGIYRHCRHLLPSVVELCAGLAQRKADFLNTL